MVLYPLSGRGSHEYFAIPTSGEPRATNIGVDVKTGPPGPVPRRYISSVVELPAGTGLIPDFQALKAAFYSDRDP